MKVIVEDLAKDCITDIYYYNCQYSLNNAQEVDRNIRLCIHNLENLPYIGRYVPKIFNKNFRELIYKRNKNSYRIVYYISEISNTIYIMYVANSKRDFNKFLKPHNYFKNFFKF